MESEKGTDKPFKQSGSCSRTRIGIVFGILLVVIAAVAVAVVFLVRKENDDDSNEKVRGFAKILSVHSSGLVGEYVTVTIRYHGDDQCNINWLVLQMESNIQLQNQGTKQKITDNVFESGFKYENKETRSLLFRLYCGDFHTVLTLDVSALMNRTSTQEDIPDLSKHTFSLVDTEYNATTGDVKVALRLNEAVEDNEVEIIAYMDGLNTSSTPFTAFEVLDNSFTDFNSAEQLQIEKQNSSDGLTRANIIIPDTLARFGGILVPGIRIQINNGSVKHVQLEISVPIKSTETGEVVRNGQFGMYHWPLENNLRKVYTKNYSLMCFIVSSRKPTVDLVVVYPNGTDADVELSYVYSGTYIFIWAMIASRDQFPEGGNFTCRASLGTVSQSIHVPFRFIQLEQCSINSTLTGIVEQTGQHDIVRCTATGLPKPEVHLELYIEYGPDLLKIPDYEVSKIDLDESTVSVNLTVSPVNQDIHTVYCGCSQPPISYERQTQKIVLHPGVQSNWTLYDELQQRIYNN